MELERIKAVKSISITTIVTIQDALRRDAKQGTGRFQPADLESMANAVKASLENLLTVERMEGKK